MCLSQVAAGREGRWWEERGGRMQGEGETVEVRDDKEDEEKGGKLEVEKNDKSKKMVIVTARKKKTEMEERENDAEMIGMRKINE